MRRNFGGVSIFVMVVALGSSCGALFNHPKIGYSKLKAIHQGWSFVQALGGRQPVSQATGLATTSPSVSLSWNAMTFDFLPVGPLVWDSYNVYRSTTSGGQDFSQPLATGIATNALTYTDATVSAGTTYYYIVRPVVAGYAIATAETDSEIKVIVPPVNMALVHRWIANQEVCGLMNLPVDRTASYRCSYSGPGSTQGFYDLGAHLLVDTFEQGCNYSPAPACGGSGCIGTNVPSGGNDGDIYYRRNAGNLCYINLSGTWTGANSLTDSQIYLVSSNAPGLPPLVNVHQSKSWFGCSSQSAAGFGIKKLLSRKEQIAAAAWSSALNDTAISSLEKGTNLPSTGACNANQGSGLTYDSNDIPNDLDTLPATNSLGQKSVRTGSNATKNCVSRYGIQDLVGNVWEWVSDQLGACSAVTHTCSTLAASGLDSTNSDFSGVSFDGLIGPGGGSANIDGWALNLMSFNSSQFLVPLGIPLVAGADKSLGGMSIGTLPGQFSPNALHGNTFNLQTDNGGSTRGIFVGGSLSTSSISVAGRYAIGLNQAPMASNAFIGYRCAVYAP